MFGRKREEAPATVVDSVIDKVYPDPLTQQVTYVLDVHPETGTPFRARADHWEGFGVTMLQAGDTVRVRYRPGEAAVTIVEKGDPRFDPELRRAEDHAQIEALLKQPPGTPGRS